MIRANWACRNIQVLEWEMPHSERAPHRNQLRPHHAQLSYGSEIGIRVRWPNHQMVDLPGISYGARVPNLLPNLLPKQVQSKEELQLFQESCVFISKVTGWQTHLDHWWLHQWQINSYMLGVQPNDWSHQPLLVAFEYFSHMQINVNPPIAISICLT